MDCRTGGKSGTCPLQMLSKNGASQPNTFYLFIDLTLSLSFTHFKYINCSSQQTAHHPGIMQLRGYTLVSQCHKVKTLRYLISLA